MQNTLALVKTSSGSVVNFFWTTQGWELVSKFIIPRLKCFFTDTTLNNFILEKLIKEGTDYLKLTVLDLGFESFKTIFPSIQRLFSMKQILADWTKIHQFLLPL